jgi:hypothetical protein
MLNFPLPYPDELIYSVVARAGAHMGITSPKQLLDEVFESRAVIATVDLPNHLECLSRLYPKASGYSVKRLAYEHTLFPLYASFTTEERRKQCLEKMAANSNGAIHLVLGVAASRLKQARYLRYCPECLQHQLTDHGEYYWTRQWQIVGAECCLEHGQLLEASINRHDYHRHQFFPASPATCPAASQPPAIFPTIKVARQIDRLLHHDSQDVATFAQWSRFYHGLADKEGCMAGQQIRHETVRELVLTRWPTTWLSAHGLAIQKTEADWLRTIFRKHRKAFSYLEHIVVLDSFLSDGWQIDDVLAEVRSIRLGAKILLTDTPISDHHPTEQTVSKRKQWLAATAQDSVTQARSRNASLYAWLYRHDKAWLLSVNRQFHVVPVGEYRRVDWRRRDFCICRQLIKIYKANKTLLDVPRMSRNWYLSKLGNSATVEKNLRKMPLTTLFFGRYCENIDGYQIRRLTNALNNLEAECVRRWRLLRLAGLSEERLTIGARCWLGQALECD